MSSNSKRGKVATSRSLRSKKRKFHDNPSTDKSSTTVEERLSSHDLPILEICVDSITSIRNAIDGGANRLELCSALSEGGLTPSLGLLTMAKRISSVPIFAMLRVRGGNFVYTQEEIDVMLIDLHEFKGAGVDGFVFGALTSENLLDVVLCRKIVEAAGPLPVTFHRAFDEVVDPILAMENLIKLGFKRILTSGQKNSAIEGSDLIKTLVDRSDGKIIVMPGAGLTSENIAGLRDQTSAVEFHGSAKKVENTGSGVAHDRHLVTDKNIVKLMLKNLKGSP